MNSLKMYDTGSSSGDSSDEEEAPKVENEEATLHLKKPATLSTLPSSTVSLNSKAWKFTAI